MNEDKNIEINEKEYEIVETVKRDNIKFMKLLSSIENDLIKASEYVSYQEFPELNNDIKRSLMMVYHIIESLDGKISSKYIFIKKPKEVKRENDENT